MRPEFRNVRWDMGDGSPPIVCEGEDVAVVFDPDVSADEQSPGCVHVYEANGAGAVVPMAITVTMTWDIWASTSSRPTERLIRPVTRQTTFVVDVRELQAVIDRSLCCGGRRPNRREDSVEAESSPQALSPAEFAGCSEALTLWKSGLAKSQRPVILRKVRLIR